MGQKVNPIVFRVGSYNKLWESQYCGKNMEESSYYLFQDLEIRKYLDIFFESNGMIIHNCIIKRSNSKLNIFINFYITSKISTKALQTFSSVSSFKSSIVKKSTKPKRFLNLSFIKKKLKNQLLSNLLNNSNLTINPDNFKYSGFKKKLVKTLLKFSGSLKVNLKLNNVQNETVYNLNKGIDFKSTVQELSGYSRERFFNEMVEILMVNSSTSNTAKLLSRFIALQFQITKRHNTFLTFLKRATFLFNSSPNSKILGIKIIITGKFNGAPRAKKRTIQSGRLPLQSFNSKIDYHNTDAFTPYGTFGVKVWICEQ